VLGSTAGTFSFNYVYMAHELKQQLSLCDPDREFDICTLT